MSTISAPGSVERTWRQATSATLLALAVVVLLAVSFVIGRATVGTTHHSPSIAPASTVKTGDITCHVNRPC
jgi:hypothetical protein